MTDTAPGTRRHAAGAERSSDRRKRGIALLVGAVVVALLIPTDVLRYVYLPLLLGLTYLAAAAVSGRSGALWGAGCVVTAFGLGALFTLGRDIGPDSFYLTVVFVIALGAGATVAALLGRAGFAVSPLSVAVPVLLVGLFLILEQQMVSGLSMNALPYAGLLAVWGLVELRPGDR